MADDSIRSALTEEHEKYLSDHAVDIELAKSLGVRSLLSHDDNPADGVWPNWANHPSILFPWTSPDGRVMYQARPDSPTLDQKTGKPRKYSFGRGEGSILWAVREVPGSELAVIIEGTKQCLAGASYAPPGVSVYGIAGCRNWQVDGSPIPDLGVVDGKDVVIILDADAAINPEVYSAGTGLAEALVMEGAEKVTFGRLPGGASKSGLDDILASRQPDRRASYLARIISSAKAKPADAKPRPRKKTGTAPTGSADRSTIVCNRDRLEVINDLTKALLDRWDATKLFNHGGVLSWLTDETAMKPIDRNTFHDLVQETVMTVNENEGAQGTTYSFAWPDAGTMGATMSRASHFAGLERISHAPFARPDGTIVTEPGYDETTRTLLIPDEVFAGIEVPEEPDPAEIEAARELIMTEWFGDFPFDGDADRANVLGLIVTPAIRGMVPRVPLAVIDGLQMGVGKNLLVDCLLTVYTGHPAQPMNMVDEADEVRKQITAAFRTGAEFFAFDEAHTLQGAALAQALTAETWQDRILGVSTMAAFPNRVTWISMGNNVQVKGDITRRVYRVALRPRYANPQDRRAETFRHPGTSGLDLGSWTRKHRRELMTAILTLVRAWFAQGSPHPKRGVSFGSFEAWERTVGGIVEVAGMPDFLGNLKVWRSESDFDTQYWINHLSWLREQFQEATFRTAEVKERALTIGTDLYSAPPKLDDPTEKAYGKALGEAYSRIAGRRYGEFWLERAGSAHGHVSVYRVFIDGDLPPWKEDPEPVQPVDPYDSMKGGVSDAEEFSDTSVSIPDPADDPAPHNERAEARGAAPEDIDGEGHDEIRPAGTDLVERLISTPVERGGMTFPQPVDRPVEIQTEALTWENFPDLQIERGGVKFPVDTPWVAPQFFQPGDKVLTFDLETGDAGDLYKADPSQYIRLAGAATDGEIVIRSGVEAGPMAAAGITLAALAGKITGHNIMAFDLPALVRAGHLNMTGVHQLAADGRIFDALLVARFLDPPMAKDKGVDATRKYDLGALAAKYQVTEKLTDISKPLAKKYGGWDAIPIDPDDADPERAADAQAFRLYLEHDVAGSRDLYAALLAELGGTLPDYLVREHRVAALATQISLNGFLVDQPLLAQRVAEVQRRKAQSMELLAGKYNIPTTDAKGNAYASPLASKPGKIALEAAFLAAGVPAKGLWRTPTSGELQVSADAMLKIGQDYGHLPGVREICKAVYRIVSARSIYETTANTMGPDGRVHPKVSFKQATGRWSLTEPGLTVFGKRGGRHVERAVLLPDPGQRLVSFDLSQVDMRAVAGLSQDKAYIEMLKHDDPHAEIARILLGDPGLREVAKPIGHGWNYGRGVKAICQANNLDPAVGWQFDTSMRERFPRLVMWQEEVRTLASSGHLLDNGFGRMMRPDPQRAHTQGPALMGQGAARDIMMTGMLNLPAEVLPMLRAQVHDEIVLSIPVDQVEDVSRVVVEALSFEWKNVPILADRSPAGTSWAMCYEKA